MTWSINVAERALPLGPIDNWIFKKDASHGFIRVKNDHGDTVLELHGCAMSAALRKGNALQHGALLAFAFVADTVLGRPANISLRLKVKAITIKKSMDELGKGRSLHEREVFKGSEEDVKRRVECALRAATEINRAHIRYVFFSLTKEGGINCHSVEAELWDRMFGKNPEVSKRYANPGLTQDLEALDPKLSTIRPDRKSSFQTVTRSIANLLPKIDVDKVSSSLGWVSSSFERPVSHKMSLQSLSASFG